MPGSQSNHLMASPTHPIPEVPAAEVSPAGGALRAALLPGAAALLLIWVACLVTLGRHEMLDDALIHLRFAAMLHRHGFFTYDGVHRSYGASSLLYVMLLSALRSFTASSLLPKMVSIAGYCALLVTLMALAWRARAHAIALLLFSAAVLVVCGPMGVRWLTDGMETSLVALVAAWLAIGGTAAAYRRTGDVAAWCLLPLAAVAVGLRVDSSLLAAVTAGSVAVGRVAAGGGRREAALTALPAALGGALTLFAIRITMGHLLPDTAIAKAGENPAGVLPAAAHILASAGAFGLGALLLWLISLWLSWREHRRTEVPLWDVLVPNSLLPALLLGAIVRGQQMQGVRYIFWPLLFSSLWNIRWLLLAGRDFTPEAARSRPVRMAGYAVLLLAGAAYAAELPVFARVAAGRSSTFDTLRRQPLDRLAGQPGVAADVGFIGYFSQGDICDLAGLVNGRTAAALSNSARADRCAAAHPVFAFLTIPQMGLLSYRLSWRDWVACEFVDFTNAGSADRHFLLVRNQPGPFACRAVTGRAPLTRAAFMAAAGADLPPEMTPNAGGTQ
jgi:hypothetical protein